MEERKEFQLQQPKKTTNKDLLDDNDSITRTITPSNNYEKVAHLIPKSTDTMQGILIQFARYALCTDPQFYDILEPKILI